MLRSVISFALLVERVGGHATCSIFVLRVAYAHASRAATHFLNDQKVGKKSLSNAEGCSTQRKSF